MSKPNAIICDIDGTLAHMVSRGPHDYHKVAEDEVDLAVKTLVDQMRNVCVIILMSGRKAWCRPDTEQWLEDNNIPHHMLFMDRQTSDHRKDYIVKEEMYNRHVKGKYEVLFVLDDRQQMTDFWRSIGLKCFQVAEGDF